MNHILKLAAIARSAAGGSAMKKIINSSSTSTYTIKRNLMVSSTHRAYDDVSSENDMSQKEIDRIKKYEEGYFTNVKASFDNLQASRKNETIEEKRSRLLYQSRKRGISENGLLLSHFSRKYLPTFDNDQLDEYDRIINNLHNEWDLYYWMTNKAELPKDVAANEVFQLMKTYCANDLMETRIELPNLPNMTKKS